MKEEKRFPVLCDYCEVFNPDQELIELLKEDALADNIVYELAELFKTMGDPTRIKILYALKDRELCVCDLSELLGMSSSAISHQLRVLRNNKLVKFRKDGRSVYYSLDDEHVLSLFCQGLQHVTEDRPINI
ncbi:MAG TPA: metalloregulator ArsR/SmtB family transcription factor [Halanaerobiales bacterium]|nr:metalloregulator ArsR/SmtB family transcription factor [Halanaerobiales bacterium]HPZ62732.1 metalloregulator ArsR/SmtB family transcription factor [Halanaerobiales bacterium]HQD04057.1 metalloregulator ArsR/SmtB family transcription factor [Halanaerobiales bacterium]